MTGNMMHPLLIHISNSKTVLESSINFKQEKSVLGVEDLQFVETAEDLAKHFHFIFCFRIGRMAPNFFQLFSNSQH
jgi:hypothetical protein